VLPFPRIDRFKEHSIELPVADAEDRGEEGDELRKALATALGNRKGQVQVLARSRRSFPPSASCPSCGRGFAELDPRLFSYNSRHGWCQTCVGTGWS
jgi:excinuclease ABC subunit A